MPIGRLPVVLGRPVTVRSELTYLDWMGWARLGSRIAGHPRREVLLQPVFGLVGHWAAGCGIPRHGEDIGWLAGQCWGIRHDEPREFFHLGGGSDIDWRSGWGRCKWWIEQLRRNDTAREKSWSSE